MSYVHSVHLIDKIYVAFFSNVSSYLFVFFPLCWALRRRNEQTACFLNLIYTQNQFVFSKNLFCLSFPSGLCLMFSVICIKVVVKSQIFCPKKRKLWEESFRRLKGVYGYEYWYIEANVALIWCWNSLSTVIVNCSIFFTSNSALPLPLGKLSYVVYCWETVTAYLQFIFWVQSIIRQWFSTFFQWQTPF